MPLRDLSGAPSGRGRSRSSDTPMSRILAFAAIFVALVGAIIWASIKSEQVAVETDSATLCPTRRPPSEVLAILMDPSEQFSEPARLQVQNDLTRVRNRMARFGLVEVYTV